LINRSILAATLTESTYPNSGWQAKTLWSRPQCRVSVYSVLEQVLLTLIVFAKLALSEVTTEGGIEMRLLLLLLLKWNCIKCNASSYSRMAS